MIDVSITMDRRQFERFVANTRAADNDAVRKVATGVVLPAMRVAFSHVGPHAPTGQLGVITDRTRQQLRARFWKARDGLMNGTVRVIGNRSHIARFGETGTKHQPPRRMFETVGRALRGTIESRLVAEFEQNMRALDISGTI